MSWGTGYYIGTGQSYEAHQANKLTFDFEPDFIWIYGYESTGPWHHDPLFSQVRRFVRLDPDCEQNILNPKLIEVGEQYTPGLGFSKWYDCVLGRRTDTHTIEWYVEDRGTQTDGSTSDEAWHADVQLNTGGVKYHYIAIAKGGGV